MTGARGMLGRFAAALVGTDVPPALPALILDQAPGAPTDGAEARHFDALIKEYELTFNALEQSVGRNVQITTAIVTTLGAAISVVPQIHMSEHYLIVVLLPAFFAVMFGILLFEVSTSHSHIWGCRALAGRINSLLPETALIRFEPSFPSASIFSLSRGLRRVQILQGFMLLGPFVLLFGLIAVLTKSLNDCVNLATRDGAAEAAIPCPPAVLPIFLLWIPLILLEMSLAYGPLTQVPERFRRFFGDDPHHSEFPPRAPVHRRAHSGPSASKRRQAFGRTAFFWLMPRPWDFACKWPCFWIGFMTVWVAADRSPGQDALAQRLIAPLLPRDLPPETLGVLAMLGLGLVYFAIEEIGFQQAKFLIDDAQPGDVKRDQTLLQNSGWRAVSAGIIAPHKALMYGIYRGAASLALAWAVGKQLFVAALVLSGLHQAIYVFVLKPLARSAPLLILFWIALNLAPRLLAGFVAVSDTAWASLTTAVVLASFIASSLGGMAAQWKMEAQHHGPDVRGQSAYLLQHGDWWQAVGHGAAVVLTLGAGIAHLALNVSAGRPMAACFTSKACPPFGPLSEQTWISQPLYFVAVVLALTAISILVSMLGVLLMTKRPHAHGKGSASRRAERASPRLPTSVIVVLTLVVTAAAALFITTRVDGDAVAWFGLLLLIPIIGLMIPRGEARDHSRAPASSRKSKAMLLQFLAACGLACWIAAALIGSLALWFGTLSIMQVVLLIHFREMQYTQFAMGGLAAKREAQTIRT